VKNRLRWQHLVWRGIERQTSAYAAPQRNLTRFARQFNVFTATCAATEKWRRTLLARDSGATNAP